MLVKPESCNGCPLHQIGSGFSLPEGEGRLGVMVFGEALGEHESRDGLPFRPYAESGSLLERVFGLAGLKREDFILYNSVNCRPPRNYLEGASYEQEAISHCQSHRNRVVDRYRPRVLVALGGVALRTLTGLGGPRQGLTLLRGYVLDSPYYYRLPVVGSYHPSFVNRGNKGLVGVLLRDLMLAVEVAKSGVKTYAENYILTPSVEEAWKWYWSLYGDGHSQIPIAFDIETDYSAKEVDESELEEVGQNITQVQFSIGEGSAIVLPWGGEYLDVIRKVMALPNPKWGWNSRLFDLPMLRAHGVEVNGEHHDLMNAWHHLQPDLPKGLQYVTSFYAPHFGPWKHLAGEEGDRDLYYYGAKDADATYRCGEGIFADLRKRGALDSYLRHVQGLVPVLDKMQERGIPIDEKVQTELKIELRRETRILGGQLQAMVPIEVKDKHPKMGYKVLSKEKKEMAAEVEAGKEVRINLGAHRGVFAKLRFPPKGGRGEERYCIVKDFLPSSSQQMLRYLKSKSYKIPRERKTDRETTGELELIRIHNATKDPVIGLALQIRKMNTLVNRYCERDWLPREDGRVHPKFLFGTATGQLSSKNPNAQQFPKHGNLAKKAMTMVKAGVGKVLINVDFRSFHAKTLAFEAEDMGYWRLADMDVHSYVAAHFLASKLERIPPGGRIIKAEEYSSFTSPEELEVMSKMEGELRERLGEVGGWLQLPDEDLKERLGWIKKHYKPVRDFQAKRAILGIGFGMGPHKLYDMNRESLGSVAVARLLQDLLRRLFPRVFAWQDEIRRLAHRQGYLQSKHGHLRYFWEVFKWDTRNRRWMAGESSEQAIAFLPANDAHGHFRDCLLEAEERGALDRYGLVNLVHDSWMFECDEQLVASCIEECKEIMTRPSRVLKNKVMGTFWCDVDYGVGKSWGDLC